MANLKVFISSTCYDLHAIRGQLRNVIMSFGHDPIMSDQAEVIFDPQTHTHTSCLREVVNCDVVVLVIGSRFGGTIVPKALEQIDMGRISDMSRADRFGEEGTKISITQAEILQAIQTGLPVFAFVDSGVMRDHLTYEKNKNKPIISQIEFSSIEKTETAAYIFEFINFLRMRNENNSIFEFSRFEDIEVQLKKQWSGLFQRLLSEQRTKAFEGRYIEQLSGQIADLKAAVLGSISSAELKETAKGAIRFRTLIDFIYSLAIEYKPFEVMDIIKSQYDWDTLISTLGIVEMRRPSYGTRTPGMILILIREDNKHYRARIPMSAINRMASEWEDFKSRGPDAKNAIINAVLDSRNGKPSFLVRFYNEAYIDDSSDNAIDDTEEDIPSQVSVKNLSRILLTKEKYIEESLKDYLATDPAFHNMHFLIDTDSEKVKISKLYIGDNEPTNNLTYSYDIPAGDNLTQPIEDLKNMIKRDLLSDNK